MRDDTSIAPTALRFAVGNLVIYKPRGMMFGRLHAEDTVGWYIGGGCESQSANEIFRGKE